MATASSPRPSRSSTPRPTHLCVSSSPYETTKVKARLKADLALAFARAADHQAGHDWLESFGLGYKRDDPSTFKMENVPAFHKGGLYNNFGVGQEQFAWDVRQEKGVIDAFAKIWGTDELLVSFDAVNLSIPLAKAPGAEAIFKPWAHVDQ